MTIFEPNKLCAGLARYFSVAALLMVILSPLRVHAAIEGITGPAFELTASEGYISIADGGSVYSWLYRDSGGSTPAQLPGPTLIVNQGDTVEITLNNALPAAAGNVSIVFPGHTASPCAAADVGSDVDFDPLDGPFPNIPAGDVDWNSDGILNSVPVCSASSGAPGLLTHEAASGGSVTYTFTAGEPGTYQYHSGTRPDLQVEMGLYGALIVRPLAVSTCPAPSYPDAGAAGWAYEHLGTCFDREYLFLVSEIDMQVHQAAEDQASGPGPIDIGTGDFHSEYWLLNGRAAPDTMAGPGDELLIHQPYNSLARMHPGEKLLLRIVGAGREMHPFHTHGNHVRVLARDGRLLLSDTGLPPTSSDPLAGPLLFTIPTVPGGTVDAIFEWTGKDLGWDMYGHSSGDALEPNEWAPDHGKPIPVTLPSLSSLAFGGFYSGSPYLGGMGGSLPPGEGGLNPDAGFTYMWHSHNEKELVNNDVFPGGMMTMLIIEAPSTTIVE